MNFAMPQPLFNWTATDNNHKLTQFRNTCKLWFSGPLAKLSVEEKTSYILLWLGEEGHQTCQAKDEDIEHFILRCRRILTRCGYKEPEEPLLDALVSGIHSQTARERILREMKPSIELLTSICQTEETFNPSRMEYGINQISHPPRPTHNVDKAPCGNCGRQHERCPALSSTYNNCSRKNHWASTCRQRSNMQHTVNEITWAPMNNSRDEVFIILMNKYKYILKAKIDTCAQIHNVLPISVYHQLHNPPPLSPPTHILLSYGNTPIDVKGTTTLNCTYQDNHSYVSIQSVKTFFC